MIGDDNDCAHETCTCTVGDDGITAEDGRHFCSEGCKSGEGCICPKCGCNMDTPNEETAQVPML